MIRIHMLLNKFDPNTILTTPVFNTNSQFEDKTAATQYCFVGKTAKCKQSTWVSGRNTYFRWSFSSHDKWSNLRFLDMLRDVSLTQTSWLIFDGWKFLDKAKIIGVFMIAIYMRAEYNILSDTGSIRGNSIKAIAS